MSGASWLAVPGGAHEPPHVIGRARSLALFFSRFFPVWVNGSSCYRLRRSWHRAAIRGELQHHGGKNRRLHPKYQRVFGRSRSGASGKRAVRVVDRAECDIQQRAGRGKLSHFSTTNSPDELRQSHQQETQASVEAAPGAARAEQRG